MSTLVILVILMHSETVLAQGRGNSFGREKRHEHSDRERNRYNSYSRNEWRDNDYRRYDRKPVYHRPPHHAPAHGYRKQVRYVYYRDYDVYYDCYRGMYILFTGRNWTYTPHMPVHMYRAPYDRIAYVELEYCDDDLPRYIERRRGGSYVSIQARF